jgi:GTP cyclohydrolase II
MNKLDLNQVLFSRNEVIVRNSVLIPLGEAKAKFVSFHGLTDGKEHIALDFRNAVSDEPVIVRVHSECLTGDIFQSSRCDCGEQLNEAVTKFNKEGGVLIYLRQEGRGIGLYNKLDAYELQLQGHDTYEANRMLGLKDDLRGYESPAQMLKAMGIHKVRLLSNNPLKAKELEAHGIEVVEMISTGVFLKEGNASYLQAKVSHTGHAINLNMATA